MSGKYKFKRIDWRSDKILVSPSCCQTLHRHDIEHFSKCPYCDQTIENNTEIEDYLLKPVIDRWMTFQNYSSHDSFISKL